MKHTSHPNVVARIKRAAGHLNSVVGMIEAERPCLELAQQLHAVESAIANAKRLLIHDHMEHCLSGSGTRRDALANMKELKELTKFL